MLGYPRITDDVKGLGDHAVANDVCLCPVTSHAVVLPSITQGEALNKRALPHRAEQTEVSVGNLTNISGGLKWKNDGLNWIISSRLECMVTGGMLS
jgi:hypothetical protein